MKNLVCFVLILIALNFAFVSCKTTEKVQDSAVSESENNAQMEESQQLVPENEVALENADEPVLETEMQNDESDELIEIPKEVAVEQIQDVEVDSTKQNENAVAESKPSEDAKAVPAEKTPEVEKSPDAGKSVSQPAKVAAVETVAAAKTQEAKAAPAQTQKPVQESKPVEKRIEPQPAAVQSVPERTDEDFEKEKPARLSDKITASRTVTANAGQTVVFNYPDNGWVYLGEVDVDGICSLKDKVFAGGKTVFTVIANKSGETLLHFYKIDSLSQKYIDDYVRVVVYPGSDKGTVAAPDYRYDYYFLNGSDDKSVSQSEERVKNNSGNGSTGGYSVSTPAGSKKVAEIEIMKEEPDIVLEGDFGDENSSVKKEEAGELETGTVGDLFEQAKNHYSQKEFEQALDKIESYIDYSSENADQALFLKGQILEEKSEVRNIKEALNCYKRIVEDYPQSDLWDSANNKIQYIQRLYFNIR